MESTKKRSSKKRWLAIQWGVFFCVVIACGGIGTMLLQVAQDTIRRTGCHYSFGDIAIAMQNYHSARREFPPAYSTDADGKPMHSWRVLLLPYLGQRELYEKIDLTKPWDSPHNRAFADKMPLVYRCPQSTAPKGNPSYLMIVGPKAVSDGPTGRTIKEIKDKTSRTLMLVEVADPGFNWMEPRDLNAEEITFAINDGSTLGIGSRHIGGANASLCDGSVHFFENSTDPKKLKAMATVDGGEEVDWP